MIPLKINQDFKNLIPPLSDEEFRQLEENILTSGRCRNAIKVWRGIIIDGHNRYAICQKHGLPYEVSKIRLPSKNDVLLWIIENQLGRRNITDVRRINLGLRKVELLKEMQATTGRRPIHVRKAIADHASVSEQTVYRYLKVKAIGDADIINRVEAGNLKIATAYKKLQNRLVVTEKVVTRMYENPNPLHIDNNENGAVNNIEMIGRLYGFIFDSCGFMKDGEEIHRISGWLRKQTRAVNRILAS